MASSEGGSGAGSGGRDDGEGGGAYPKNLEGLLKFSIENTAANPDDKPQYEPMSEERAKWLQEALKGLYRDDVKEMKKCLEILTEKRESEEEDDIASRENALDYLEELCESMDNARDFHKIGGIPTIKQCLDDANSGVRWRAAELIATMAQNNPYCQNVFIDDGFLKVLLTGTDKDSVDMVRVKSLYAVSCIVRTNAKAQEEFVKDDGFSVVIRAMQSNIEKLQIKAAFMVNAMITDNATLKDTLYKMGFVQQLVGLLETPHNASHEHILSILSNLVTNHSGCLEECKLPAVKLEDILRRKIDQIKGKEEYQEELEFAQQILKSCFSNQGNGQAMDR
ncbi:hsp70-binding protein 1-like [Ptychodera flava]|uniref:hsp70-binding protein 1-like n=1 Tax=Ptychodera flava TaxID=63121 RepID=UPI00396A02E9